MSGQCARDPRDVSVSDRKKALHELYRRAKHLDKKWAVGWRKPDGFAILAIVPIVGGCMTTSLAIGYVHRINDTFFLPKEVEQQLSEQVISHFCIASIPLVGWILRRGYAVNKRNYKVIERYVMSMPLREEDSRSSGNARTNTKRKHHKTKGSSTARRDSAHHSSPAPAQ